MMRVAYLDCFSGISGDMFLGALIDAGISPALLEETVAELNAAGHLDARLEFKKVNRSGISATKVDVIVGGKSDEPRVEHHHYQEHRHGHTHEHAHEQVLGHSHGAHEQHQHSAVATADVHEHSSGAHSHRGLREIREIIGRARIGEIAKERALAIFQALGEAEAKIHNVPIEQIHFHEVGAADAIVDIVCAAVGSEALQVEEWVCSPLNLGAGTVECAHGSFPVPAPATAELLSGAPVFSSGIQAELVTPTGAAIVKTLVARFAPLPGMKIGRIGYGAGSRDFHGHANVLRILVGESGQAAHAQGDDVLLSITAPQEKICVLEAEIDDLSPQIFAYVVEQALRQGALDAFGSPVHMKKGRTGMLLTVLTRPEDASRLTQLIFRETSTLGVRVREENRVALPRSFQTVETEWGEVRMKIATRDGAVSHYAPEYEDCRRIAEERRIPLKQVMQEAVRAYLAVKEANAGKGEAV